MKALFIAIIIFFATSQSVFSQTKKEIRQAKENKELVTTFFQKLFGDQDFTSIDTYIANDYIQHNPKITDGKEALKKVVPMWMKGMLKRKIEFYMVVSEGDKVVLYTKNEQPDGKVTAVVDIFRVKNKKIVEHWDIMQAVPEKAANSHPMF